MSTKIMQKFVSSLFVSFFVLLGLQLVAEISTVVAQSPMDGSTKSVEPENDVQPGDVLSYTIVLSNVHGTSDITNVILSDTIPTNTTYISPSISSNAHYSETEQMIWWSGTVTASKNITITYQAAMSDTLPTPVTLITNTAVVSASVLSETYSLSTTSTARTPADLSNSSNEVTPTTIVPGEELTYTLTLKNSGGQTASSVVMTNTIPTSTTLITTSVTVGATYNEVEDRIEWSGNIDGEQEMVISYRVMVTSTIPINTPITNTAFITAPTLTESVVISNTVMTQDNVPSTLIGSIFVDSSMAYPDDVLNYTILITNTGSQQILTATLVNPVPNDTTLKESSLTGGANYDINSNTITNTQTLDAFEVVEYTYQVDVNSDIAPFTAITNTVTITATSPYMITEMQNIIWADCGPEPGTEHLNNPQRTGQSIYEGDPVNPLLELKPKWILPTNGADIRSSVVISGGSMLVFGDYNGFIRVIETNLDPPLDMGQVPPIVWQRDLGDPIRATPALAKDGTVIVVAGTTLYAVKQDESPEGSFIRWQYDVGSKVYASPLIWDKDGTIYVLETNGILHAVYPDGTEKWVVEIGESTGYADPAMSPEGVIYIASKHYLTAINPDSSIKWQKPTGDILGFSDWDSSDSPPTVSSDGTIYVGSTLTPILPTENESGWLFAFNPEDGSLKQINEDPEYFPVFVGYGEIHTSPSLSQDEQSVYVAVDNRLKVFPADGSSRTLFYTSEDGTIASTPRVDASGKVYVTTSEGKIFVLDADGVVVGKYDGKNNIEISVPSIAEDHTIYIGTDGNELLALIEDKTPQDIQLISHAIRETAALGEKVGDLYTVSPVQDTFTYDLIGDADGLFDFCGSDHDEICLNDTDVSTIDQENSLSQRQYTIRVRTTGSTGLYMEKDITIDITPVNEFVPTNIHFTGSSVDENTRKNTLIGNLVVTEPDNYDTDHKYSLVKDTCGCFGISGKTLVVESQSCLDYEAFEPPVVCTVKFQVHNGSFDYEESTEFTINIIDIDEPPDAQNDGPYGGYEDTLLTIPDPTLNDKDPEGKSLTITRIINGPDHGTLTGPADADRSYTYNPEKDSYGNDSFVYEVTDGGRTDRATVYINIIAVNDDPTLDNNGLNLKEGKSADIGTGNLKANDVDNSSSQLKFTIGTQPQHGELSLNGNPVSEFTQENINNSELSYEHDGSETTADSFTFSLSDGSGGSIANQVFNVTITPVNDPPVLETNEPLTLLEGSTEIIDSALLYATDPDNTLNEILYELAQPKVQYGVLQNNGNSLSVGNTFTQQDIIDNKITYKHFGTEDFQDSFDFIVKNADGVVFGQATFNIHVTPDNDKPIVAYVNPLPVNEGTEVCIDTAIVHATDEDHNDDEIRYVVQDTPLYGQVKLGGTPLDTNGFFTEQEVKDSSVCYTHNGANETQDSFTFVVKDKDGAIAAGGIQKLNVVVSLSNDAPTISGIEPRIIKEDTTTDEIAVIVGDEESLAGDLTVTATSDNTTLVPNSPATIVIGGAGANRTVKIVPAPNKFGSATITVCVEDEETVGKPKQKTCTNFTLTVNPVADTPQVTGAETDEDTITSSGLSFLPNTVDRSEVTYFRISDIVGGTLYHTDGTTRIDDGTFITAAEAASELRFVPDLNRNDDGSFLVCGATASTPDAVSKDCATATITIIPVNDDPVLEKNDPLILNEGAEHVIDNTYLLVTDVDNSADQIVFKIESAATNGDLLLSGARVDVGSTFTQADVNAGKLSYQHQGDITVEDSFEFSVSDGASGSLGASKTFTINMDPVNDVPEVTVNSIAVDEGANAPITNQHLSASDEDDDPDALSYRLIKEPVYGDLYLNGAKLALNDTFTQQDVNENKMSYVHDGSHTEEDSVTLRLCDDDAGCKADDIILNITITTVNDAPVIETIANQTIYEDYITKVIQFIISDEETPDGNLNLSTSSSNVDLVPNDDVHIILGGAGSNRTIVVKPLSNEFGQTTIKVCVEDSGDSEGKNVLETCKTFVVIVKPVADTPPQVLPIVETNEGELSECIIIQKNENDRQETGYVKITNITDGRLYHNDGTTQINSGSFVSFDEARCLRLSPDIELLVDGYATFNVQASLTADDGGLGDMPRLVQVLVHAVNDAPQLVKLETPDINEGGSLVIDKDFLQVTDVDNTPDQITYRLAVVPTNGEILLSNIALALNDTFTQQDINEGKLRYTHNGSETNSDAFAFTVKDGSGEANGTIDYTLFPININPVNDVPILVNYGSLQTSEEVIEAIIEKNLLEATDSEHPAESLEYTLETVPQNGVLQKNGIDLAVNDTFTQEDINKNRITYTHTEGEQHSDSFSFTICDPEDACIDTKEFEINATPVNDAPELKTNTGMTLNEGENKGITREMLEVTDRDHTAADIQYTLIAASQHGSLLKSGGSLNQNDIFTQQDINQGKIAYEHSGSETTSDSFSVSVKDGDGASIPEGSLTFAITVDPSNDLPTITDIPNQDNPGVPEDGSTDTLEFTIGDEESSIADLQVIAHSSNADLVPEDQAHIKLSGTGNIRTITIIPVANKSGDTTISLCVIDGNGAEACDDIFVNVYAVADKPVAEGTTTFEDVTTEAGKLVITRNEIDSTEVKYFKISDITGGTLSRAGGTAIQAGSCISVQEGSWGLRFHPTLNSTENGSFLVQGATEDCTTGLGEANRVVIQITPVNDPPVVEVNNTLRPNECGTITIGEIALKVTDIEDAPTQLVYKVLQEPQYGVLSKTSFSQQDIADGEITYTHDCSENLKDSFTFEVKDTGGESTGVRTMVIKMQAINKPPIAKDDTATCEEGGTIIILDGDKDSVLHNDSDPEELELIVTKVVRPPYHGTLKVYEDGTFEYTNNGDETKSDSFVYEVCDVSNAPTCSTATVNITITPVNDEPVAQDDRITVDEGKEAKVLESGSNSLIINDKDLDGPGLKLEEVAISDPENGTLKLTDDGTFSYTHDGSETTQDSFTYRVCDTDPTKPLCSEATVYITINPVNDAPVGFDDNLTVNHGGSVRVTDAGKDTVLANDTDAENNKLTSVLVESPKNGTLSYFNLDGTFEYVHDGGGEHTDQFIYKVCDNGTPSKCDEEVTVYIRKRSGIEIPETQKEVTEGNGSATYKVCLTRAPTADVTILVEPQEDDPVRLLVKPDQLLFPAKDWHVCQMVEVFGLQDDDNEDNTVSIKHTASSSDFEYRDITGADVIVTVLDVDKPGLTFRQTDGSTIVAEGLEEGGCDSYEVVLNVETDKEVTVNISGDAQVDVKPKKLTFKPGEWNEAQSVTVCAIDDKATEYVHTGNIFHDTVSADLDYATGKVTRNLEVTINDDDSPGVRIIESGSTKVKEGSYNDSYQVYLLTQPEDDVEVSLVINCEDQIEVVPLNQTLLFNETNWRDPQSIQIKAMDDNVMEGEHYCTISHGVKSTDDAYSAENDQLTGLDSIKVTIIDDDLPGISIDETGGQTKVTEDGGTDTYYVTLNTQPKDNVQVTIYLDDQLELKKPAGGTLVFTEKNWDIAQLVKIAAIDDELQEGITVSTISHRATSNGDEDYNIENAGNVQVTTEDNDIPDLIVAPSEITIKEGDRPGSYAVSLRTKPKAAVTISFLSDNQDIEITPPSLEILPTDFDKPHTFSIKAPEDTIASDDYQVTITHSASSDDPDYNKTNVKPVIVTVEDNDTAGLEILNGQGIVLQEEGEGNSDTYSIKLNTKPQQEVTVEPVYDTERLKLSYTEGCLTFTPADWTEPCSVRVKAIADGQVNSQSDIPITHRINSEDQAYNILEPEVIEIEIVDDDTPNVEVVPSGASTNVSEAGDYDSYQIRLTVPMQEGQTVQIEIVPDDQVRVGNTDEPILLTFNGDNYDDYQTVTVFAQNDVVQEGDHFGTIKHNIIASGNIYEQVTIRNLEVSITDDDVASVLVDDHGYVLATEGGDNGRYKVSLMTEPKYDVKVSLAPNKQVTTEPRELTFTAKNWDKPQTVTVRAVLDNVIEGDHDGLIIHSVTSKDTDYDQIYVPDTSVSITDGDEAKVDFSHVDQVTVYENGDEHNYFIVLKDPPAEGKTVTIKIKPDATQLEVTPQEITFNAGNWDQPRTIRVNAKEDDLVEGIHSAVIEHTIESDDDDYSKIQNLKTVSVDINDDNTPSVYISDYNLLVSEGVSGDSYSVRLATQPRDTVEVQIIAEEGQITVNPSKLIFNSNNWAVPQDVSVQAVNDTTDEGGKHEATIIHKVVSDEDEYYNGIKVSDVSVDIDDDDSASLIISSDGLTNIPEGTSSFYTIRLSTPPEQGSVKVAITAGYNLTVTPNEYTFDQKNWDQPVNINVKVGEDDKVNDTDYYQDDQRIYISKISHQVSSETDPAYNAIGKSTRSIEVSIVNIDVPNVLVPAEQEIVSVAEGSSKSDFYTVMLTTQPAEGKTVKVSVIPSDQVTVVPSELLFNSETWDKPQRVNVVAVNDQQVEFTHYTTIKHSVSSEDNDYNSLPVPSMEVTIADNDSAGVDIIQTDNQTRVDEEGLLCDSYTVRLTSPPASGKNVYVNVNAGDKVTVGNEDESSLNLLFTENDWELTQKVRVCGKDDNIRQGNHHSSITHSTVSEDSNYDGLPDIDFIDVEIIDNDNPGLLPKHDGDETRVYESGVSDTYTLRLTTQPAEDETVEVTISTDGQVSVIPDRVTFNAKDYMLGKTILVKAIDDKLEEGDIGSTIRHGVTSVPGGDYNALGTIPTLQVTVVDNDLAGVEIIHAGGTTRVEEGGFDDTVTMKLKTKPEKDVIVTCQTDSQLNINPDQFTFTPDDWNGAKAITIRAFDDEIAEPPIHSGVVLCKMKSNDIVYDNRTIENIAVDVEDNDTPSVKQIDAQDLVVIPGGNGNSYQLVLRKAPDKPVDITLEATFVRFENGEHKYTIRFDGTDNPWDKPRTIKITMEEEALAELAARRRARTVPIIGGPQDLIRHTVESKEGENEGQYHGVPVEDVPIYFPDEASTTVFVEESNGSTQVIEGKTSDNYVVRLSKQPEGIVEIAIKVYPEEDASKLNIYPTVLRFTDGDEAWQTGKTVTVSSNDNSVPEGQYSISTQIQHTISEENTTDPSYSGGLGIAGVNVIITGTEGPRVLINETSGSTNVTKNGAVDYYNVVLSKQPSSDCQVDVTVTAGGQLTIANLENNTLTFDSNNWNMPQMVRVEANDDENHEGSHEDTISHTVSSCYDAPQPRNVTVFITDDEKAGVSITDSNGWTAMAEGKSDTYEVVLTKKPTTDVTININVVDKSQVTVSPLSVTFTPDNYNVPQLVTVTATPDSDDEGRHFVTIKHSASGSSEYAGIAIREVIAVITEEAPDVEITPTIIQVGEGSGNVSYNIELKSDPSDDVFITLQPKPDMQLSIEETQGTIVQEGTVTLVFNKKDKKTVLVNAVDDVIHEGDHQGWIVHSVTSNDPFYSNIAVNDVNVDITDNDPKIEVTLKLEPTWVEEDSPKGTVVGTFSIEPANAGKPTFKLEEDAGGRFEVVGDKLLVKDGTRLDYEKSDEHLITVKVLVEFPGIEQPLDAKKSFTIEIQDERGDPTDITISNDTVYEDHVPGTPIGRFFTTDQDAEDAGRHTYELLKDADGLFDIMENKLILALGKHLEYDADGTNKYVIEVRSMDPTFKSVTKPLTITVEDVVGGCSFVQLGGKREVMEHAPTDTVIGNLLVTGTDVDAEYTFQFKHNDNAGGRFVIVGNELRVLDGTSLDFERQSKYTLVIQATNSATNLSCSSEEQTITVLNNPNDPTSITLNGDTVEEDKPSGTLIGTLSAEDPDTLEKDLTYQLLEPKDGRFAIRNRNELQVGIAELIDYEQAITHTIRVRVIDTDGLPFEQDFTIAVKDVTGDPKDIWLSNTTVPEKSTNGTVVGTFTTEASELYSVHTYSLPNSADGRFTVSQDGKLMVADGSRIDCNDAKTYTVRAVTTNEAGLSLPKEFVIELKCVPPAKILGELIPSTHNVRELDTALLMAMVIVNKQDYAEASPINNVRIRLNKMTELPLYDNGTHGDFAQNDGMYATYYQFKGDLGEHTLELICEDPDNPSNDLVLDSQSIVVKDIEGLELIVLTDWKALYDEFRDTGMTRDEDENDNGVHDFADLVMRIERYTEAYSGTVVDLPSNIQDYPKFEEHTAIIESGCAGNYADIPYGGTGEAGLKNRHCKGLLIDELVWHYVRHGTVKNVVILGDDEVVPFYRVQDPTSYYGQVSGNTSHKGSAEQDYMKDDDLSRGNPVLNDMNLGYIMSDVPYSVSGVQNITRTYDWVNDPKNQRQPAVDVGIGRIFDLHPWSLKRAIDNWEKPVQIKPGTGKASIFIGGDTPVNEGGSGLDMHEMARQSMTCNLGDWFEDNLSIHDPNTSWTAYTLLRAFEDIDVIPWMGHADHMSFQIRPGSTIQGSELQDLDYPNTVMVVGLGCHMGLAVNDHGNDEGTGVAETYDKSWVVNTMGYGHGIAFFAPTTFGYVYGKDIVQDPVLHERMSSLFVDYMLDNTVPDIGNLWKRVYHFYNASYPTEDRGEAGTISTGLSENSEPTNGSGLFHTTAAYGVAFYGLPTQKMRTAYADLCPVNPSSNIRSNVSTPTTDQALPETNTTLAAVEDPAPNDESGAMLMADPVTTTFEIPLDFIFETKPLADGTTLVSVQGGTYMAPPNREIVPSVLVPFILPKGVRAMDVSVQITEADTEIQPGIYRLPKAPVNIISGGVIKGNHPLPSVYPQEIYSYEVTPDADSSVFMLSVTPLQYRAGTGQVTYYRHLKFTVTYTEYQQQAANVSLSAMAATPASSDAQPATVAFDGDNEEIQIGFETPSNVPSGYAILSWVVHNLSGDALTSDRKLINMDDFRATGEITLTHQVDTTGWPSLENMTMDIRLHSCQQQGSDGGLGNIIQPETIQIEPGTVRTIFDLRDQDPRQQHKHTEVDEYATWTVAVYDRSGVLQTPDLSNKFNVFVAGKEFDQAEITQDDTYSYTIKIPLNNLAEGTNAVRFEVSHTVTIGNDEKTFHDKLSDQLTYEGDGFPDIIENPKGTHTYDLTDDVPDVADFELDVGVPGLTKDDFNINVDGRVCGTGKDCDFDVEENLSGHYKVTLKPLTKDMGPNPKVTIEAGNGEGSSKFTKDLTLLISALELRHENTDMIRRFLPYMRNHEDKAKWLFSIHDQDGIIPEDLSENFSLYIDGELKTIAIERDSNGYYVVRLPFDELREGKHTIRIEVFRTVDTNDTEDKKFIAVHNDRIEYVKDGVHMEENPKHDHIYDMPGATAEFDFDVLDENGDPVTGQTEEDFVVKVNGETYAGEFTVEESSEKPGHYKVKLPLDESMGLSPEVEIEVKDDEGHSTTYTNDLTLRYEDGIARLKLKEVRYESAQNEKEKCYNSQSTNVTWTLKLYSHEGLVLDDWSQDFRIVVNNTPRNVIPSFSTQQGETIQNPTWNKDDAIYTLLLPMQELNKGTNVVDIAVTKTISVAGKTQVVSDTMLASVKYGGVCIYDTSEQHTYGYYKNSNPITPTATLSLLVLSDGQGVTGLSKEDRSFTLGVTNVTSPTYDLKEGGSGQYTVTLPLDYRMGAEPDITATATDDQGNTGITWIDLSFNRDLAPVDDDQKKASCWDIGVCSNYLPMIPKSGQ